MPTTADRVKSANEDTQLAFYAALLPDDTLRAAYVNISERETRPYEQKDVVAARDALLGGIRADLAAIADGAPLPALGDLLQQLGRNDEARAEFSRAAELTGNAREREVLAARAAACSPA